MNTPICDFVTEYGNSGALRLHMPGHKGTSYLGVEALDITEIDGADVLYQAKGIIRQSEENAAALFGTAKTVYSTEGSSLAIRAMLYLTLLYAQSQGRRPLLAAGRNAHKSFLTAAALLDIDPLWIYPKRQEDILSCEITPEELESFFAECGEEKPVAVYITSPDYLGNVSDIGALADVCHRHGALLLVDNAHGAYLKFLPERESKAYQGGEHDSGVVVGHPMELGADICCDSAHKTLPVLTGGAYLHIGKGAPDLFVDQAERAMSMFASTSPSYLILQSLDRVNRDLAEGYEGRLTALVDKIEGMKKRLTEAGYTLAGREPLKLTIKAKAYGYTGHELAELLMRQGIICEFSDADYVVMMFTPDLGEDALNRLEMVLVGVGRRPEIKDKMPQLVRPQKQMSPREAMFLPGKKLEISQCCGKMLVAATVSCPPAIPVVVCGEMVDEAAIKVFEYYGIETCVVY